MLVPTRGSLETSVRADLEQVESLLRTTVASDHPMLADAGRFLIDAGGKRFRPMLTLLAGRLGDGADPRLVPCAAAIELTHLATLYHDDVMDETPMRRGVETAHRRYGNARAILVGDFLFARASGLAADLGGYVSRRLADTIAELVEGQIVETELAAAPSLEGSGVTERIPSAAEHLEVLRLKTATLIATSAHLGAWLAGCAPPVVEAVTRYGMALGVAFQLTDDLLDIDGDPAVTGKALGTDLREGVLTLPSLLTFEGAVEGADALRAALDAGAHETALALLRGNGSIDAVRAQIRAHRDAALGALTIVPDGPARAGLTELASSLDDRTS